MNRFIRLAVPMAAFALLVAFSYVVRADDKPAGAAADGAVSVTVTDADGKAVEGVTVRVHQSAKMAAKGDTSTEKPADKPAGTHTPPVAEGKTDKDGKATLSNVPAGDYNLSANLKGTGSARQKISVKAGDTLSVELKLTPRTAK